MPMGAFEQLRTVREKNSVINASNACSYACFRDAASAELELEQLQEVQLSFQRMAAFAQEPNSIWHSLEDAVTSVLHWLDSKADGSQLASKGFDRFEGVWAGPKVTLQFIHDIFCPYGF